jgi:hypothetical protein
MVPLVAREVVLHASGTRAEPQAVPFWIPWYLLIGAGFGAAAVGAQRLRDSRRLWSRLLAALAVLWCLISGLAGAILLYIWFFSDHAAARPNENILQCTILALPLVVLIPLALKGRRSARRAWLYLSLAIAALSILGLILQALPMMNQVNGQIIALSLPANLGLAYAAWLAGRARVVDAKAPV